MPADLGGGGEVAPQQPVPAQPEGSGVRGQRSGAGEGEVNHPFVIHISFIKSYPSFDRVRVRVSRVS